MFLCVCLSIHALYKHHLLILVWLTHLKFYTPLLQHKTLNKQKQEYINTKQHWYFVIQVGRFSWYKLSQGWSYLQKKKIIFIFFAALFKCHLKLEQKYNNMQTWFKKVQKWRRNIDSRKPICHNNPSIFISCLHLESVAVNI